MRPKLLIVDDDHYTVRFLQGLLRHKNAELAVARDATEARRAFQGTDFNLVLMDKRLPDGSGLDLLRDMRRERPQQVAILMTGYADVRDAVRAVRDGLFDYLTKPFENPEELEAVIEKALELDSAYREIHTLRQSLDDRQSGPRFIGDSPAAKKLLTQVRQVAPLDATVLLQGESGTGKELIARFIHAESAASKGHFLDVNCGALPENLLESILFGYEKGAFTGADKSTPGYFEKADNGTLFLDEITDMSPKLQSSLLRVLQQHTFSRLGSSEPRRSSFRLICATNKSLEGEVREGRFREDLFYRINVIVLNLPPLRERASDIIRLATYFLEHFNAKFNKKVGPLTPEGLRLLERFPWPGNVRQLEHTIERIVAFHPGGPVGASTLDELATETAIRPANGSAIQSYNDERQGFERTYFTRLMTTANGNMSEAARLSGMSRQNLYVHLKRWGVTTQPEVPQQLSEK